MNKGSSYKADSCLPTWIPIRQYPAVAGKRQNCSNSFLYTVYTVFAVGSYVNLNISWQLGTGDGSIFSWLHFQRRIMNNQVNNQLVGCTTFLHNLLISVKKKGNKTWWININDICLQHKKIRKAYRLPFLKTTILLNGFISVLFFRFRYQYRNRYNNISNN